MRYTIGDDNLGKFERHQAKDQCIRHTKHRGTSATSGANPSIRVTNELECKTEGDASFCTKVVEVFWSSDTDWIMDSSSLLICELNEKAKLIDSPARAA